MRPRWIGWHQKSTLTMSKGSEVKGMRMARGNNLIATNGTFSIWQAGSLEVEGIGGIRGNT